MSDTEFEGPAPAGRWARWKQIAIFVLAPSIILGLFTVAPKLYEIATSPSNSLTYIINPGPVLSTPAGFRQIYAIKIFNNGNSSLGDIVSEVTEPSGQIETETLDKGSTDAVGVIAPGKYVIKVGQMLPTEMVSLSLMTLSSNKDSPLRVNVRSHEVLGHLANNKENDQKDVTGGLSSNLIFLIPAALALTLFQLIILRRRPIFLKVRSDNRGDIVSFIARASDVLNLTDEFLFAEDETSFRRLSDAFFIIGKKGDLDMRRQCINGLCALCLVKGISDESISVIRSHLKMLGYNFDENAFTKIRNEALDYDNPNLRYRLFDVATGVSSL